MTFVPKKRSLPFPSRIAHCTDRFLIISATYKNMADPLCCAVCTQPVHSSAFCSSCGANFCDKCWGTQIAHQSGRAGDSPHEKSDPHITLRLQKILTPATDPAKQKQLHLNDSDTTWLRYFKSSFLQEPELLEHARYKKLMQDSFTSEWKERWPQLVSFIGQTGKALQSVYYLSIAEICRGREKHCH